MRIRSESDPYVSIKIPSSLKKRLLVVSAVRNEFLYQTIAFMLVREIEEMNTKKSILNSKTHQTH